MSVRPMLVVTDLSDAGDSAVRVALALARSGPARLVVAHVLPQDVPANVLFPHLSVGQPASPLALNDAAEAAVQARVTALAGTAPIEWAVRVLDGVPTDAILALAADVSAGVIVVPPGALAAEVARARLVPVVVARPSPAAGPVIGATDFSDAATPALRAAAQVARDTGAPLVAAHCVDLQPMAALGGAGVSVAAVTAVPDLMLDELAADARHRLSAALADTGAAGTVTVTLAPPGPGLVELARTEEAALVVVGTHGRTGLTRLFMGSVATYVADHAPCSVMIVPLGSPVAHDPPAP